MCITLFLAGNSTETIGRLSVLLEDQSGMQIVGTAKNGRDTLEQIGRQCPDVLILGSTLCQHSKVTITRHIHKQYPHVHVIFLTDRLSAAHAAGALRAGSDAVLLYNVVAGEIVQAVQTVYKNGRYLSQQLSNLLIEDYVQQHPDYDRSSDRLARLSLREREVLQLVVEGKSSVSIADRLTLSPKTVETYRSRLMQKLNINNLPTLVKFAIRHELIPLE